MAYEYDRNKRGSFSDGNSFGLVNIASTPGRGPGASDKVFFELEAAEVIDIILTEEDLDRSGIKEPTFSDIGKARVRMLTSEYGKDISLLQFARPLDTQIKKYPLKHEIVIVIEYLGELYYTQTLNIFGSVNHNAFPNISLPRIKGENKDISAVNYNESRGIPANSDIGSTDDDLSLGVIFKSNTKIKPIAVIEGDVVFEGRFGHSLKFGSNPENGKPSIKIRNEQPREVPTDFLSPITEDINNDGSSIYITGDETVNLDMATIGTPVHNRSSQEKLSELSGRQIIITSDRIVWNAKAGELFGSAKKSINFMTDGQFTIDSGKQFIVQSDNETIITAPNIFLGSIEATEPIVLGNILVELLSEMLDLIISHKHPTGTGPSGPPLPPELLKFNRVKRKLESALSPQNFTL